MTLFTHYGKYQKVEALMINFKKTNQDPLLKQVGGKRWAKDFVREFWKKNGDKVLVEPFAGGISAILTCKPQSAIAYDTNPHLINFYKQSQEGLVIEIPLKNDKLFFYEMRKRFNGLLKEGKGNTNEAAQIYYFLNKTCYNGLMRFNKKGFYNTPFGHFDKLNYKESFLPELDSIKDIDFQFNDFRGIPVNDVPKSATWVIDPPYYGSTFNYGLKEFTWEDQLESMEWASKLSGPVLYTNTADPRILEVLHELGFETQIVYKKHTVGASARSRKDFGEVFAWKNAELPEKYPKGDDWRKTMKLMKGA